MQATPNTIRIGTRASKLAVTQAEEIKRRLCAAHGFAPDTIILVPMTTTGDARPEPTLADVGGKGLFTKEIEEALLRGDVDIAVHSLKDMPAFPPEGLIIAAVPEREDPRDAFVSLKYNSFASMPAGAKVGTSSPRRAAILKYRRPDIEVVPLRGNVGTRIDKLKRGEMDATILAVAGLNRLGMQASITQAFPIGEFLPAVGQGALCVQSRAKDSYIVELLAAINHETSFIVAMAERALLACLDGSCRTPIAGHAFMDGELLNILGMALSPDGSICHSVHYEGLAKDAFLLGEEAGKALLAKAGPALFCA